MKGFSENAMLVQSALLKDNADVLVSLRAADFFNQRMRGLDQILVSLVCDDIETVKRNEFEINNKSRCTALSSTW